MIRGANSIRKTLANAIIKPGTRIKNFYRIQINIPLGFEFSFAGLPEVGVSAEAGLSVDFQTEGGAKAIAISSVGGNVGGNLGLGIHYYF